MTTFVARIPTGMASKYLLQLCKHWGHRFDAEFNASHGHINFGDSRCILDARECELGVTLIAQPEEMAGLPEVIADHIQRFAHREGELGIIWKIAP